MNFPAQSGVSRSVADAALNKVAGMAGKKVADLAMNKALPALRSMDRKQIMTLAALTGIGLLVLRAMNREVSQV